MKPVVFHEAAESEFREAVAFYETRRAGLGLDLQSNIEAAVRSIQRAPGTWPVYKDTKYRQRSIKRFPYAVYYWDREDHIWIVAIAHQSRRPGYWSRRAPG